MGYGMMDTQKKGKSAQDDFFVRHEHNIIPEPNSGCWIWLGTATRGRKNAGCGYGHFRRNGQHFYAHRAAYEAVHGHGSAAGLLVRHACDFPLCVNPDHLSVGTHLDNARDMRERGRSNYGAKNSMSRLTIAQVKEIVELARRGRLSQKAIGEKFGIDQSAVSLIYRGLRWGQAAPRPKQGGIGMSDLKTAKLLHQQMKQWVENQRREGWPSPEVEKWGTFVMLSLQCLVKNPPSHHKCILVGLAEYSAKLESAKAVAQNAA